MRFFLLLVLAASSITVSASELKCKLTTYTLEPHRSSWAKALGSAKVSETSSWQDCYSQALLATEELGYGYEDYVSNDHWGDLMSGNASSVYSRGFVFLFVEWTVNDSMVGFLNGSSGRVNSYSSETPQLGDQRLDHEGRLFQ